jgi:hypothetical protein
MGKKYQISIARKLLLLVLGVTMMCFAVSPKTYAIGIAEIEQHAHDNQEENNNKSVQEYFKVYEAIIPVSQLHLSNDLLFEFEIFILEEHDFEPTIEKPFFVNNHRKILFSRIISPNAP